MSGKSMLTACAAVLCSLSIGASERAFVDHSYQSKFVEGNLHALVGGSYLAENYASCFPSIRQMSSTMGVAYGAGAGVTLLVRDYFGFGTELNVTVNHSTLNVFTYNNQITSASNLYMRNSYTYVNIPVFVSWRFNVASTVKWILDTGAYYSYGLAGHQDQTLYRSLVNDLGQLVYESEKSSPDFFKSHDTFQNSFRRSDVGVHVASSLLFNGHFLLGARTQIGVRNMAYVVNGIKTPRVHNISFMVHAGWVF